MVKGTEFGNCTYINDFRDFMDILDMRKLDSVTLQCRCMLFVVISYLS